MSNHDVLDACTGYGACILLYLQDVNWTVVGATLLLVARLVKDVPDAYDAIASRVRRPKKKQTKRKGAKRGKSKR